MEHVITRARFLKVNDTFAVDASDKYYKAIEVSIIEDSVHVVTQDGQGLTLPWTNKIRKYVEVNK